MRAILASVLSAIALGGCAMTAENLHRSNTSARRKAIDFEYCKVDAQANTGPMSMGGIAGAVEVTERRNALFKLCMLNRGYIEGKPGEPLPWRNPDEH